MQLFCFVWINQLSVTLSGHPFPSPQPGKATSQSHQARCLAIIVPLYTALNRLLIGVLSKGYPNVPFEAFHKSRCFGLYYIYIYIWISILWSSLTPTQWKCYPGSSTSTISCTSASRRGLVTALHFFLPGPHPRLVATKYDESINKLP